MRKFTPTFNNVLVKMLQNEGQTRGGIYLPSQATSNEGIIEAVGPGITCFWDGASDEVAPGSEMFKVGDRVIINGADRKYVDIANPSLCLIEDKNILCIVTEADPAGN